MNKAVKRKEKTAFSKQEPRPLPIIVRFPLFWIQPMKAASLLFLGVELSQWNILSFSQLEEVQLASASCIWLGAAAQEGKSAQALAACRTLSEELTEMRRPEARNAKRKKKDKSRGAVRRFREELDSHGAVRRKSTDKESMMIIRLESRKRKD
ncbi:protein transport protein sec23-1 isoform X2 [Cucumis melo var. makuwa]|uniref:Protein transport protein sec23-1 isoform X2 n=1 Tax=Cucumis melo var. makuwa TaxID=1194695 RepID=A0A5A7UF75_CUCMM|nr:protein transport protein sec23-1 isoform X2 [Cucumis melo var. makuwa]